MRTRKKILWVLFKTALFTALVPFMVGLRIPYYVNAAYSAPTDTLYVSLPKFILGLGFMLVGAAIYLWCAWDFAVKGLGTPAPIDAPKTLVVNGLYRFVRNPMYLGVLCLIISQSLISASIPILLYLVFVAVCFHLFITFYEEPRLRTTFGEQYEDYCRRVPRWLPRLHNHNHNHS
jgi:protein-S-isoprenylcysteine O-methyltransferase Ste14